MRYEIYGLRLKATRPIPGLRPASSDLLPDVEVSLEGLPSWLKDYSEPVSEPWYLSWFQDAQGRPGLKVWLLQGGAFFWLRYGDGRQFVLDRSGSKVWASWPATGTLEDVALYLLGPVLGMVLRLRGVTCLHASAVVDGGQAFVLVGPARAGKSTTAAAFARRGYPVLSEDVAALTQAKGGFLVQSGYGHIRLWPQSVSILFGSTNLLPQLAPPRDKRGLDLLEKGFAFQAQPAPLAAIYILGARTDAEEAPFVDGMPRREGLMQLVGNGYGTHLADQRQRAEEFAFLGRLMEAVPVRRVTPHSEPTRLDRLCDVILEDFQQLAG